MTCARGKATPNQYTKLRLFADCAGFCQKPDCLKPLFLDVGNASLHMAEIAHVCAALDHGPRAKAELSSTKRGAYENLILLCPSCHTVVDKAPGEFPDSEILRWKYEHKTRVANLFGIVTYSDRSSVRRSLDPLLIENRLIFEAYGPDNEYQADPESELAEAWQRKVLSKIIPNNRRMLAILDMNIQHLTDSERGVVEEFRQHVDDLEARHIGGEPSAKGKRFPVAFNMLLSEPHGN